MTAISDGLAVFVSWLARSSVQACVLVVLILLIQAALRDRLRPRWRYGLWMLLIVRLALPWAPESSVSVYNLMPEGADTVAETATFTSSGAAAALEPAEVAEPNVPGGDARPSDNRVVTPNHAVPDGRASGAGFVDSLPVIWLLGAVVLAGYVAVQSLTLATIRGQRPVTDQQTLELLEDCKEAMGVRTYLAVVETSRVKTPSLFGFVRPRLLLPAGAVAALGPDRLRHVFLHELAHLKRHDIAMNWLTAVLQILHWFDPEVKGVTRCSLTVWMIS